MSRTTAKVLGVAIALALGAAVVSGPAFAAGTTPASGGGVTVGDPDGDGRVGEDTAIRDRVRHYHQRHGDNDAVTGQALLHKARWAYERYLEAARSDKGIAGSNWVRPAPSPLNVPANWLAVFVTMATPLNALDPLKVWWASRSATFEDSRASASVPVTSVASATLPGVH